MRNSPVAIRKILFATDFSEYSEGAREHVRYLAEKLGSEVIVFHAIELVSSLDPDDREMKKWYQNLEAKLRTKLGRELAYFQAHRLGVSGELLYGTPWKEVTAYAERQSADLIVVGSHGLQTHDGRLLLGTTSQKISLVSRIPVLIVPAGVESTPR